MNPFTNHPFAYEVRGIYRLFTSSEFRAIVLSITPDLDNRRIICFASCVRVGVRAWES
jgi:hypothetical protein